MRRFLECRVLGQVVDRIPPVTQLTRSPIDKGGGRAIEIDALQPTVNFDLVCIVACHDPRYSAGNHTYRGSVQRAILATNPKLYKCITGPGESCPRIVHRGDNDIQLDNNRCGQAGPTTRHGLAH